MDNTNGPIAKLNPNMVLYNPMTRPRRDSGVISLSQVSDTTNTIPPEKPPRNRITNHANSLSVSISQIIRRISTKTPTRSNFLPPAIFKKYGTKNELSITPIAGVVAKLPIKKLLAPRCSRSSDNKGL